jgi:hypothetical protein
MEPEEAELEASDEGPRLLFAEHRRELEATCRVLERVATTRHAFTVRDCFLDLERAVLDHIDAEAEEILPIYGQVDPQDAARIRHEHAQLRSVVVAIANEMGLRPIHVSAIRGLADLLRMQAQDEAPMYEWARRYLPMTARKHLFVRLGNSLHVLVRRRAMWNSPLRR